VEEKEVRAEANSVEETDEGGIVEPSDSKSLPYLAVSQWIDSNISLSPKEPSMN